MNGTSLGMTTSAVARSLISLPALNVKFETVFEAHAFDPVEESVITDEPRISDRTLAVEMFICQPVRFLLFVSSVPALRSNWPVPPFAHDRLS